MHGTRLRSEFWILATVRRYNQSGIPAVVVRRGDDVAGDILVKMNCLENGCTVFTQTRSGTGELVWLEATGAAPVPEPDADAYIARRVQRDPDIWVLEVEDRQGRILFRN